VLVVALLAGLVSVAQAQRGSRRRSRGARGRRLGLLSLEQVQKELKLSADQIEKIKKITEEITAEMRKEFEALRDIEDRDKRRAKMIELGKKYEEKARAKLHELLPREKMGRLYQIRMQIRRVVDSLANGYVARRLKLTDAQKEKVAKIAADARAKRSEIYRGLRDASEEKRAEAREKLKKIRAESDKQALALLTDEQKKAFEEMKGKKFELKTS